MRLTAKTPRRQEVPASVDRLGRSIVQAAYNVHKGLGPGLLESVYEVCFCHELKKMEIPFRTQVRIPVQYDGLSFDAALRLDVLVDDQVVCELKSVELLIPLHQAQLISYLRLAERPLGYLINFNVPVIKNGIKRLLP